MLLLQPVSDASPRLPVGEIFNPILTLPWVLFAAITALFGAAKMFQVGSVSPLCSATLIPSQPSPWARWG